MAAAWMVDCATGALQVQAQNAFPATLAGHAVLPAMTLIPAPKDAPADLQDSGKFTNGQRVEKIGSVVGQSAGRSTGVFLPFKGQPVRGHSGIKRMADGSFCTSPAPSWALGFQGPMKLAYSIGLFFT